MSHLTDASQTITIPCKHLKYLKKALAKNCPELEFMDGQNEYRTWKSDHGKMVGDWPITEGMSDEDIGKNADHVIRMTDEALTQKGKARNQHGAPYEIGLIRCRMEKQPDGSEKAVIDKEGDHWILLTDFYGQASGLMNTPGLGKYYSTKDENGKRVDHSFELLYQSFVQEVTEGTAKKKGDHIPKWSSKALKQLEKDTGQKVKNVSKDGKWAKLEDDSIVGVVEQKHGDAVKNQVV